MTQAVFLMAYSRVFSRNTRCQREILTDLLLQPTHPPDSVTGENQSIRKLTCPNVYFHYYGTSERSVTQPWLSVGAQTGMSKDRLAEVNAAIRKSA